MKRTTPAAILILLGQVIALAARNPYGIQVSYIGAHPTEYLSVHYDDAVRLVGEWGHIRVGSALNRRPEDCAIPTLIACRAKHLIPIMTGQVPPGMDLPKDLKLDPDGTYDTQARFFEDWARRIYDAGFTIPYYEMGNEPQGRWKPEEHARWCVAAAKAFHRVDPNIKVSPAGMGGPGADYYRDMLKAVPELRDHMALWSCHPYAANRPPQYPATPGDDLTIQGYKETIRALRESGVEDPKIICTETGWEIGGHADKRFPYITEELRAEYVVEAWTQYWARDPCIVAVTPFMLQSIPWTGWETWDFIKEDGSYTPQYSAMAMIPKPEGEDYLPRGNAGLKGRVTDGELGSGIEQCFVYIVPESGAGAYAAETDEDGNYTIANAPAGKYFVSALKTTYTDPGRHPVTLVDAALMQKDLTINRMGMINAGFGAADNSGMKSDGFQPYSMDSSVYAWDGEVGHKREGSLRISPKAATEAGYWVATDYCAAVPGESYAAEVWVKTEDFAPGPEGGIRVYLESTDGNMLSREISWAPGPGEGTHDWTPVNVTVYAPPKSRRHRLAFTVKGISGKVWFDDTFADKADLPLPSAREMWKHTGPTGRVTGRVTAADQSMPHNATVFLTPGNFNTKTDRVGRFEIDDVPPGEYAVSATHRKWSPHHGQTIEVNQNESVSLDITLPDIEWPSELVNGDMEQHGDKKMGIMVGWKPYGIIDKDGCVESGWMEGKMEEDHPGFFARSGSGLLGYVSAYNTKNGCSYQTVQAERNALYEFSAWIMTVRREGVRGDVANRIGIDPMGLDDPESPYIIWTPFRPSPDEWSQVKLLARANRDRITVLLGHQMISGIKWSGNFFDDVELKKIAGGDEDVDIGITEGGEGAHLPFAID